MPFGTPDPNVEAHVEVENLAGPDPNEGNNRVTLELSVIAK
jgi:hypothetical protein